MSHLVEAAHFCAKCSLDWYLGGFMQGEDSLINLAERNQYGNN